MPAAVYVVASRSFLAVHRPAELHPDKTLKAESTVASIQFRSFEGSGTALFASLDWLAEESFNVRPVPTQLLVGADVGAIPDEKGPGGPTVLDNQCLIGAGV